MRLINPNPDAFLARAGQLLHAICGTSVATLYDYVGDPQRPFPWLTWNNRPYASPMELLLVPASQPARFGWEYNYKTVYTDRLAVQPDPYAMPSGTSPAPFPAEYCGTATMPGGPTRPGAVSGQEPPAAATLRAATSGLQPALCFIRRLPLPIFAT